MPHPPFGCADHSACVRQAVATAVDLCAGQGLRLTPLRQRALEILLEEQRAMGAYELLERLAAEGSGATPPTAYRALDFLVTHGLAHRIEGANAFVACTQPGVPHLPVFLRCTGCGQVAELPGQAIAALMGQTAAAQGFAIARLAIEAEGTCPACPASGTGPAGDPA